MRLELPKLDMPHHIRKPVGPVVARPAVTAAAQTQLTFEDSGGSSTAASTQLVPVVGLGSGYIASAAPADGAETVEGSLRGLQQPAACGLNAVCPAKVSVLAPVLSVLCLCLMHLPYASVLCILLMPLFYASVSCLCLMPLSCASVLCMCVMLCNLILIQACGPQLGQGQFWPLHA